MTTEIILCEECKWWGMKPDYLDDEDDWDPSLQIPGVDHKNCQNPKVGGSSYNSDERQGEDSLDSYEAIGTGPKFGCIHGEKKT